MYIGLETIKKLIAFFSVQYIEYLCLQIITKIVEMSHRLKYLCKQQQVIDMIEYLARVVYLIGNHVKIMYAIYIICISYR